MAYLGSGPLAGSSSHIFVSAAAIWLGGALNELGVAAAADRRGIGVVLLFGVTAKSDGRLIIQDAGGRSRGRSRLKRDGLFEMRVVTIAIVLTIATAKILTLL